MALDEDIEDTAASKASLYSLILQQLDADGLDEISTMVQAKFDELIEESEGKDDSLIVPQSYPVTEQGTYIELFTEFLIQNTDVMQKATEELILGNEQVVVPPPRRGSIVQMASALFKNVGASDPYENTNERHAEDRANATWANDSFEDDETAYGPNGPNRDDGKNLPLREDILNDEERISAAAINLVRARQKRGPVFFRSKKQLWGFIMINRFIYKRFLMAVTLCHIGLTFYEVPPMYYHLERAGRHEELNDVNYYSQTCTFIDFGCCACFILNLYFIIVSEGGFKDLWKKFFHSKLLPMFSIVTLLTIDAGIHALFPGNVRWFRPLRPMIFVLSDAVQTRMFASCLVTLRALIKTFLIVFVLLAMYAIVGLNLFSGYFNPVDNLFGAACLEGTGYRHPFKNIGESFVSVYTLATGDNHPYIVAPFMSCNCDYVANNATCTSPGSGTDPFITPSFSLKVGSDSCGLRRMLVMAYFVCFIVSVFFGLGNIVLAVCYYHFEKTSQSALLDAAIRKRHALLQSFYYANEGGYVRRETFYKLTDIGRSMNLGVRSKGNEIYYFESLDENGDGVLEIQEYFHIVEMMQTKINLGKGKGNKRYASWKHSKAHQSVMDLLQYSVFGIPVSDIFINSLIVLNAFLAAAEETRTSFQNDFADVVTVVFILEAFIKVLAYGPRTYWFEFWNRFDFYITTLSGLAYIGGVLSAQGYLSKDSAAVLRIVSTARLIRLIRTITLVGRILAREDENYFQNVISALASAIPACKEMLILIIFYIYCMGNIALEMFGTTRSTSRDNNWDAGSIRNIEGPGGVPENSWDWTTMSQSMLTCLGLLVGNTWSNTMYRTMDAYGFHASWFFIVFHFLGIFLMLNIVQAVFVYAFSTFMDQSFFKTTWENLIGKLDDKLNKMYHPKLIRRQKQLDNVMLTQTDMSLAYVEWLAKDAAPHLRSMVEAFQLMYNSAHHQESINRMSRGGSQDFNF